MKKKCTVFSLFTCLFLACMSAPAAHAETGTDITTLTDSVNPLKEETYQLTLTEDQTTLAEPIKIAVPNKGGLSFSIRQDEINTEFSSLDINLYRDSACTDVVDEAILNSADKSGGVYFSVPRKQTYYMNFTLKRKGKDNTPKTFLFTYGLVNGTNTTLKNAVETISYSDEGYAAIYHKVTVAKPGILKLQVQHEALGEGTYALYNSDKKAISSASAFRTYEKQSEGGEKTYAVGKGTYYYKVTTTGAYRITSTFTAKTADGGSSKAKATPIKVGSSKRGLILTSAPLSKKDWYKLTLTEPTKVTIIIDSKSNGTLELSVDKLVGLHTVLVNSTKPKSGISSQGEWGKGSYYINIGKNKVTASGEYTLSVVEQKVGK